MLTKIWKIIGIARMTPNFHSLASDTFNETRIPQSTEKIFELVLQ